MVLCKCAISLYMCQSWEFSLVIPPLLILKISILLLFKVNVDNGAETHVTHPYACPVTCQSVDIHHILSSCGKSSLAPMPSP